MLVEIHGLFVTRTAGSAASYLARWTALALLVVLAGPSSARASPDSPSSKVKHYTMRAEVVQMPDRPDGYVTLRHEPIDEFTDETGKVVGMNSMVMPFPVGRGTSLKGIAVGDKIEATLAVDWDQGFMELQRITKLPRQTALHFGKARQAGNPTARSDVSNPEKQP
jgi:Cu/Ag efflux protein CusF